MAEMGKEDIVSMSKYVDLVGPGVGADSLLFGEKAVAF